MNSIVPQQNDFDLFAKLIVMDRDIRRQEVNGTIYFVMTDILSKISDTDRKTSVRMFWANFKRSDKMKDVLLSLQRIPVLDSTGKRTQLTDAGDYAAILYVVMSLPDDRAKTLRNYVARRIAQLSEPAFKYLMRQQSEGKALAAEEIRHLYEIGHLALPEPDDPFADLGYQR